MITLSTFGADAPAPATPAATCPTCRPWWHIAFATLVVSVTTNLAINGLKYGVREAEIARAKKRTNT